MILQPDSLTANVAAQTSNPVSLLNWYRRLIHLRSSNSALGSGELVAVDASSSAVAAYLRRDGTHVVLVIANLGTAPLSGVSVTSRGRVLTSGHYSPTDLLGGAVTTRLDIGADGVFREYVPFATLAPMQTWALELKKPQ